MSTDPLTFLSRLRTFIDREFDLQRRAIEHQWSQPISERVLLGVAIQDIQVDHINRHKTAHLTCPANDSRFREGDLIVIHQGDPEDKFAGRGFIEYEDETCLDVSLRSGEEYLLDHSQGWIADQDAIDLKAFYYNALDDAADTFRGRSLVLPALQDERKPQLDFNRYEYALAQAQQSGLNDSQAEAVAQAYATDLFHLIQGPPGTGKTWVLAHLAKLFVEEGLRVLVTALTHRAINNALNKIHLLDAALPVCKVGLASGARDLIPPNHEYFALSGFGDLEGGYIVGATPFATRTERLSGIEFDVVIFDESSQVTLPLAIMGMLAGSKFIFIGDDKQLPPVTVGRNNEIGRTSIFGYLNGRGCETMLTTTYRLNAELASWPSQQFYEGRLVPADTVANRRLEYHKTHDTRWAFALNPAEPVIFLDLDHRNSTVRSRLEAEVTAELLVALIGAGIPPWEIGVVTPYRAQSRIIRNLFRQLLPDRDLAKELVIDTVERMQGQEREVVLVSLTTSSAGFAAKLGEFFFQPERLNVSITRPRCKLIILGSQHVLKAADSAPEEILPDIQRLADLLAHCKTYNIPGGAPV